MVAQKNEQVNEEDYYNLFEHKHERREDLKGEIEELERQNKNLKGNN